RGWRRALPERRRRAFRLHQGRHRRHLDLRAVGRRRDQTAMRLPLLIAAWPALPGWLASAAPWVALGLTTLVLVVALRTRWKRTPILTRCVVLSLYAHLL